MAVGHWLNLRPPFVGLSPSALCARGKVGASASSRYENKVGGLGHATTHSHVARRNRKGVIGGHAPHQERRRHHFPGSDTSLLRKSVSAFLLLV